MGFDLYEGENVDVVGDAHKLSKYFDKKFDLIFSSAVFEHFCMPWLVADEMIKLLKPGGYIFVETHYSYSSHERPWHFFQFSEQALKVLFSEKRGIKCVEAGVSNPIKGCFAEDSANYLAGRLVKGMYCHSEFLGKKIKDMENLSWEYNSIYEELGTYPKKKE
ncbi:class I SAM-dependent methyltransferase [Anaerocolumna jejuensis]|uniref:class I SAM-dependent methyltransferase n=1 Tax=Anaerocolumna jejuensis TaxID=259063 RepID=UPI003F7CC7A9